jgi:hypothetical protein
MAFFWYEAGNYFTQDFKPTKGKNKSAKVRVSVRAEKDHLVVTLYMAPLFLSV